jgi:hypothetical protein
LRVQFWDVAYMQRQEEATACTTGPTSHPCPTPPKHTDLHSILEGRVVVAQRAQRVGLAIQATQAVQHQLIAVQGAGVALVLLDLATLWAVAAVAAVVSAAAPPEAGAAIA